MFSGSPIFVRIRNRQWVDAGGAASWLLMVPGLALILLALSILIWPELLAYLVAGAILMAGIVVTGWGWSMQRAARRRARNANVVTWTQGSPN
jgi:hypothetical protein